MRILFHGTIVVVLTALTQLGGLAWLLSLRFRLRLPVFLLAYAVLWGGAQVVAPAFGRVPLPCTGEVLRQRSWVYCVMLRNFVTPDLAEVADDAARSVAARFPGTVTLALDGSFPFGTGIPLLPHLSHDDGEKLDFAFYYRDEAGYVMGETASPLGYFAFLRAGDETCPPVWVTLRWNMGWFQVLNRDLQLEPGRTRALIAAFVDDPRVAKIFVEPPVAAQLGLQSDRLRFQGCRAARHDDHIHIQL